jgi:hypothetical protein
MVETREQFSSSVIQIIFHIFDCIKLGVNDCGNDSFIPSFVDLLVDIIWFDSFSLSNEPLTRMIPTCFGYFRICQRGCANRFLQFGNARSDGKPLICGSAQSVIIFRAESPPNHANDWSRVRAEHLRRWIVSEGSDPHESWVKLRNTKGEIENSSDGLRIGTSLPIQPCRWMAEFEVMHGLQVMEIKVVLADEEILGYQPAKNRFSLSIHGDDAVFMPETPDKPDFNRRGLESAS